MALGNTPRRETSFYVEASKSYAFGMRFVTPDGNPIDLTDSKLRLVASEPAYQGGVEVISKEADSADLTTGFVQFNFQAEDLALEPGSYAYDVTLIPDSGYSTPIIKGFLEIGANTDLDASNTYFGIDVGSELTITPGPGDVVEVTIERVDGLYVIVSDLMEDFAAEMQAEVKKAEGFATDAADSAQLAKDAQNEMQVWLDNAGYPFWKGTPSEYQAINPKQEVMYLLTEEATR